MLRRLHLGMLLATLAFSIAGASRLPAAAGEDVEPEILARSRVLPDVGPGLIALRRDAAGRYYVLAAPANSISIWTPEGKRAGQIPDPASGVPAKNKIVFAADMDVDPAGRVFVADRGANAIKIFAPDGSLAAAISVSAPTSVAALPGDEVAVTSLRSQRLVAIYNVNGKFVRNFGDLADFAPEQDLSRTPDLGSVAADPSGNIYFVFSFLPVPTMRRFDRFGYAGNEIALEEFAPKAHARPREVLSLDRRVPEAKPEINALAVDPATQEIWIVVGDELLRFDKEGVRQGAYATSTPAGARLAARTILVEPDRLLLGSDPLGVFDFARPAKAPAKTAAR